MDIEQYTIDAAGKSLGRVASEAATLLRGKNKANFAPNRVAKVQVNISNADKLAFSEKKLSDKKYLRYTGYPGGQKELSLAEMIAKHGYESIIKKAIYGMLPDNKLRSKQMKNISVK